MENLGLLDEIILYPFSHSALQDKFCVMEAVAWFAHERWTDHPKCACPILSDFMIGLNDNMDDVDRQLLKQFIPQLINSKASHEVEAKRAQFLLNWGRLFKDLNSTTNECFRKVHHDNNNWAAEIAAIAYEVYLDARNWNEVFQCVKDLLEIK
jgi:hypothetical protein